MGLIGSTSLSRDYHFGSWRVSDVRQARMAVGPCANEIDMELTGFSMVGWGLTMFGRLRHVLWQVYPLA